VIYFAAFCVYVYLVHSASFIKTTIMKKITTSICVLSFALNSLAQKTVQTLQPTRLSIFKNGTYFIKKSGVVDVVNNSFTIATPTNALMGSYWLATSKDASIKSIVVKPDSVKVIRKCNSINDYLKASINKKITLRKEYLSTEILEGTLLDFNEVNQLVKIKTKDNKIIVSNAENWKELVLNEEENYTAFDMNVAPYSTIQLNQNVTSTTASSLSLEKGIQWFPSYLFTVINDKEATLAMKATILNNDEHFTNTDVDIIIGNPEMFYGKELDPICTRYLTQELLNYKDNNQTSFNLSQNNYAALNIPVYSANGEISATKDYSEENKDGNKLEDLYIYKLGKLDLEKNATVIVPVVNSTINYEDVYTADLGIASAIVAKDAVLDVYHKYRISNKSAAPFTTGSILVLSKEEMPIAQSQLKYTPVKGKQDISISKAIDVQIKNEETEIKREKIAQKNKDNEFKYKINYSGVIKIENFQNKKIKLCLTKDISGEVSVSSNNGKSRILKSVDYSDNNFTSLIEWEVEINPGQKLEITYNYSSFSWMP
jgi:hypothetical protein